MNETESIETPIVAKNNSIMTDTNSNPADDANKKEAFLDKEISRVLTEVKQELIVEGYSSKTLKMYLLYAKEFFSSLKKPISSIEKKDVVNYLANKKEAGCANSTISLIHASLEYVLSKHLKLKVLEEIKIPKKAKTLPKVLTKDEIRLLFENTKFGRNRLMLQFMYGSGCRVSEVVNLKVGDINLKERTAVIRSGKGSKDRIIILSKDWCKRVSKYLSKKKIQSEFVFSKKNGKKITTDLVQRVVRNAAKKAGINKHVTPHSLRHSYATHLLEAGTNIRYIQSLLGHSNLNTTQVYTNVASEQLKKITSPLDEL